MNNDTPNTQTRIDVAVIASSLVYIRQKLDQICLNDEEQNKRIERTERAVWAIGGVSSVALAIVIPLAVAALKVWFGL